MFVVGVLRFELLCVGLYPSDKEGRAWQPRA